MDDPKPGSSRETQFPEAQVETVQTPGQAISLVVSRIWIATLVCLIVALALVWLQVRAGGPAIDVHFSEGYGLQPSDPEALSRYQRGRSQRD